MGTGDGHPPRGPLLLYRYLPADETEQVHFLVSSLAILLQACPKHAVVQAMAFLTARIAGSQGLSPAEQEEQQMAKQAVKDLKKYMSPTSAARVTGWMLLNLMLTMPDESPEEMGVWKEVVNLLDG